MRTSPRPAVLLVILALLMAGCAPRQVRTVAVIDPAPLLQVVRDRDMALGQGLAGTLELDFRQEGRRFRGTAHVVMIPDGRFRIEVPGPLGSTLLIMTGDGHQVLAYYPEEGKAFRSTAGGKPLSPYLPFPFPVAPLELPALVCGVLPGGPGEVEASAGLLRSGKRLLSLRSGDAVHSYSFFFGERPAQDLDRIAIQSGDGAWTLRTADEAPFLPRDFRFTFPEGRLRGSWEHVALYSGNGSPFTLAIPGGVAVTDLEAPP